MSMRLSDKVFAKSRGAPEDVFAFAKANGAKRLVDVDKYAREVYRLCALAGMDASLVIAQSHLETGGWGAMGYNKWWEEFVNPAGMGIPSDPTQIEPHFFQNGVIAAQAQVVHLALYASGEVPDGLKQWQQADFRMDDYFSAFGHKAVARTIDEFGSGKWAEDDAYSEKWVGRGNIIWPNLPNQEAGTTPQPQPGKTITWRDIAKKPDIGISFAFGRSNGHRYGPRYCRPDYTHVGLDIGNMPRNTELFSLTEGVVEYVTDIGVVDDYYRPQYLIVKRDNGHRILYGHMWLTAPRAGDRVTPGTYIGNSGEQTYEGTRNPDGTGPHCHLEIWVPAKCESGYKAVDPDGYDYGTVTIPKPPPKPDPDPNPQPGKLPVPLVVDIIPETQKSQRPGTTFVGGVADGIVFHETGNTTRGAGARANARWVAAGADGQKLSVHAFIDDKEIVQQIPLDEQAYHGGDGSGPCNTTRIATEWCVNADADRHKVGRNVRAYWAKLILDGKIRGGAERFIREPAKVIVPHKACSGKQCPQLCLGEPDCLDYQIAETVKLVKAGIAKPPPQPPPPPPPPPPPIDTRTRYVMVVEPDGTVRFEPVDTEEEKAALDVEQRAANVEPRPKRKKTKWVVR